MSPVHNLWFVITITILQHSAYSKCPNLCSGHGTCGKFNTCNCDTGYNGGAVDCSYRECPSGTAWVNSPYNIDQAHNPVECSNAGICDRQTGQCQCFEGYSGYNCQRNNCPNQCFGHGNCLSISDISQFYGPDYDPTSIFTVGDHATAGDSMGSPYLNWDRQSVMGCVCEIGYFGADCSLKMCPKSDDPYTIDQNYRSIRMTVYSSWSRPLGGIMGLQFLGHTHLFDISQNLTAAADCETVLSNQGAFGDVHCEYQYQGFRSVQYDITFLNWPLIPKENNIYVNNGTPSKYDFYCDNTLATPFSICIFEDLVTENIREYEYCGGRGKCDFKFGECSCLDGYGGPACNEFTIQLPSVGSNALPSRQINLLNGNYTGTGLKLTSQKSSAPDFNFINVSASNGLVQSFFVRGDGAVGINKLRTLQGGQTISGGGLFVASGGLTIQDTGMTVTNSADAINSVLLVGSGVQSLPLATQTAYRAVSVSSKSSSIYQHFLFTTKHQRYTRYSIRGDGLNQVRAGGVTLAGSGGLVVNMNGLAVKAGGLKVMSNGLWIANGGLAVTDGLSIVTNGLKVLYDGIEVQETGMSISSVGLKITSGGARVYDHGVTVTGGVRIQTRSLLVSGGLTVQSSGLYITAGLSVMNGGLATYRLQASTSGYVASGGLSVNGGGGIYVSANGLTVAGGGASITGGLTISSPDGISSVNGLSVLSNGMVVALGSSINSGGVNLNGGLSVVSGGVVIQNALTVSTPAAVSNGGMSGGTGLTVSTRGLVSSGGLSVMTGTVHLGSALTVTSGLSITSQGLAVYGGLTIYGSTELQNSASTFSDRRLKTQLQPIQGSLETLSKMNGVYYNWVENNFWMDDTVPEAMLLSKKRQIGLMAQEVRSHVPEAVDRHVRKSEFLTVNYETIIPLLLNAVNELHVKIKNKMDKKKLENKTSFGNCSQLKNLLEESHHQLKAVMQKRQDLMEQMSSLHNELQSLQNIPVYSEVLI